MVVVHRVCFSFGCECSVFLSENRLECSTRVRTEVLWHCFFLVLNTLFPAL